MKPSAQTYPIDSAFPAEAVEDESFMVTVERSDLAGGTFSRIAALLRPGFHSQMVCAGIVILLVSIAGCRFTHVNVPGAASLLFALLLTAPIPCALYFWLTERGWPRLADSILTFSWAVFFYTILNFPVTIAARLGMTIPYFDQHFIDIDHMLGVHVPAIAAWSSHHGLDNVMRQIYSALIPMLWAAVVVPTVLGRARYTQRFLVANLVAFSIGLPLFAILPAVGPWYGFHLAIRPDEMDCQLILQHLRSPGEYLYHPPAGIICFPSFHVIWAILCTYALWGFRWLRVPLAALAAAILFSTMALGVHYFVDVLGGLIVASASIFAAQKLRFSSEPVSQQS